MKGIDYFTISYVNNCILYESIISKWSRELLQKSLVVSKNLKKCCYFFEVSGWPHHSNPPAVPVLIAQIGVHIDSGSLTTLRLNINRAPENHRVWFIWFRHTTNSLTAVVASKLQSRPATGIRHIHPAHVVRRLIKTLNWGQFKGRSLYRERAIWFGD